MADLHGRADRLLWIPYILDRTMVRGLMGAMANPSPRDKPQSPWAQRLYSAHLNAVENLVVFATLVLILHAQDHSTQSTVHRLRDLLLGAARARGGLRARHPGAAHARLCGRLCLRRSRWCWRCSGS